MREDLEELIASIDERSVSYIFTTGYKLTYQRALALKEAGLFGIAISLDSLDAQRHNGMRHNDHAYDYAVEAIKMLKGRALYNESNGMYTRITD